MSSKPRLQTAFSKSFRIGTGIYGWYFFPYSVEHTGKSNHKIAIEFNVEQSADQIVRDVYFYVMKEEPFFTWIRELASQQTNVTVFEPKEVIYKLDKITKASVEFDIRTSGSMYLIFSNTHSVVTRKNIKIEILESWEEPERSQGIFTTIPPNDESLKEEIEGMIKNAKESLKIISPYIDMSLINKLIQKLNQGVDIKIIIRDDKELKGLVKEGFTQVQKNFPKQHKIHKDVHSRIIVRDDSEAIVSSADLNQKSLQAQLNLGVKVSEPILIKKILSYFTTVWNS